MTEKRDESTREWKERIARTYGRSRPASRCKHCGSSGDHRDDCVITVLASFTERKTARSSAEPTRTRLKHSASGVRGSRERRHSRGSRGG